ncbi:tail assembly chaperone gp38 [Citrobacter braakii]|uniref:tail fiber assembly protein n=1 Tax=Citrobacter braakii TaxID=57706 RepID=UPI000E02E01B|nr:tail fiber assembly protein [Citrobacter braakii]STH95957.1 tail assembly chaperone gp38 [Citrobacter braakii]
MQHLKNLRIYTPVDKDSLFLMKEHNAEFFISDDGRDWYKSQADFSPDTLKVAYDKAGVIRSVSKDVSSIYPRDFSVVEIDITENNQCVDIWGGWVFDDGEIKPRQYSQNELCAQAEAKKTELLSTATSVIAPLQDASDLGDATAEEAVALSEWKKYRVKVMRVDTSKPEWPTPPDVLIR